MTGKAKADDLPPETESAREKAFEAYESARRKAAETAQSARDAARKAGERTKDSIDNSPVAAVLGAVALGAFLGALLPASRREADVIGPLGNRVADMGKAAFSAANEAGRETLAGFGVSQAAAQGQFEKFLDIAVQTIVAAGDAAARAKRG